MNIYSHHLPQCIRIKARSLFLCFFIIISGVLLTSCIYPKKPFLLPKTPMTYEVGVQGLIYDLLRQVENSQIRRGLSKEEMKQKHFIALAPFADAHSGDIVMIREGKLVNQKKIAPAHPRRVQDIILQDFASSLGCGNESCASSVCQSHEKIHYPPPSEAPACQAKERRFTNFVITSLNTNTLAQADYIIYGVIDQSEQSNAKFINPHTSFKLYASVLDRYNYRIIAKSGVKITGLVAVKPMAIYQNMSLYLQQSELAFLNYKAKDIVIGSMVEKRDQIDAMLLDAAMFYEAGAYEDSRQAYLKAIKSFLRAQTASTYSAQAQASKQAGKTDEAKAAEAKALEHAINSRDLKAKLLFAPGSAQFPANKRVEYEDWLDVVGRVALDKNQCLKIIGHASNSGTQAYSQRLSQLRARTVQHTIWRKHSEVRSNAYGKGFSECKVCSGTDDERDAFDRRVEIQFIENCGAPP